MQLYFLRHGIAEPREEFPAARDFERALTQEGRRKIRCIAKAMRALELDFDLILSSPFVRAHQTAEIVADTLNRVAVLKLMPELGADATPRRLLRGLLQRDLPERVLLVGHEPLFSSTMAWLIGGNPNLAITMKKGGLGLLSLEQLRAGRCAALEWLLTPRQLCRIR